MCFGGGQQSPAATIYMPKTSEYDRQFEMQKTLLENQMSNNNALMQQQLSSTLDRQRELMDRLVQSQVQRQNQPQLLEIRLESGSALFKALLRVLLRSLNLAA